MKVGLKSSLLPRFFPVSCSGELQSCCVEERGHEGESLQELQTPVLWQRFQHYSLENNAFCREQWTG